ncbi:MAG: hypothetical protein OEL89_03960, partial [Candidatus Peregrinibacteria bacterium]|nr:hypothetical protein [Candidatus Peregrinibacteria bacterium]
MKNMCQTIGFNSPKTSGATLVSTNLAITWQFLHPNKRVGILQLTAFPDAHIFAGIENNHTIFDMERFIGTPEFSNEILSRT